MLIRFFRHSYFPQHILLVLIGTLLWLPVFMNPPYIESSSLNTPLYNVLISFSDSKLFWAIFAFVCILLQAIVFNTILTKNEIIKRSSLLGALAYLILMSHHPSYQHLYPALIANFYILGTIYFLMRLDEKEKVTRDSFRIGFYIGLGSLFYFPIIIFIILIYTTLLQFRSTNWQSYAIPFFSVFTPYIFLFTFYFLFDQTYIFTQYLDSLYNHFSFWGGTSNLFSNIISILLAVILFIAFMHVFLLKNQEKSIQVRKKVFIFFNLLIVSVLGVLFVNDDLTSFTTFLIPLSLYLASYFNELKKTFWIDLYFSILLILIFINAW